MLIVKKRDLSDARTLYLREAKIKDGVVRDRANYPVYFHCIAGADRTGALAYMLLGALGVSQHDAEVDWESTFYPKIPDAELAALREILLEDARESDR